MHVAQVTVVEWSDLIRRAIAVRVDDPCPGGVNCPRCRLASAASELSAEHDLPFDYFDQALRELTRGLPVNMTEDQSNAALARLLDKWSDSE